LLHKIGEDRSERLDIVPAQFRLLAAPIHDGVVRAPILDRGERHRSVF
jgi:hypothetical protein